MKMTRNALPNHQILQQAAQWFATLAADEVCEQDRQAWQQWLASDEEHRRAWQYVDRVGHYFHQAQQQSGGQGASAVIKAARSDRVGRRALLGGAIACLTSLMIWRFTPLSEYSQRRYAAWNADYRTDIGESQQVALSDGGQLWLNTESAADVHYSSQLRAVSLHQGEILIQTAQDSLKRAFVVNTRFAQLTALGTRFSVQVFDKKISLAVFEGAVEIRNQRGKVAVVKAGEQAGFDGHLIEPRRAVDVNQQVWTRGLFVADNLPLHEVVDQLSRYRAGYLAVNPAIAHLPVIGTYPIGKPDHALAMLEAALPVQINRLLPWWITIEPR